MHSTVLKTGVESPNVCRSITLSNEAAVAKTCLLYTSDAADERSSVDLGGRRIIKKKKREKHGCGDTDMKKHNHQLTRLEKTTDTRYYTKLV